MERHGSLEELEHKIDQLKEQRDELLEALQTIKDSTAVLNHLDQDSIDMVCAAIAKATSK